MARSPGIHRGVPACFWRPYCAASFGIVLSSSVAVSAEPQGPVPQPRPQPLHVAFQYDAPSAVGCPSEPDFRAAVAGLLDYDPFVPEAARTVSVEIGVSDGTLHGVLSWRNQAGVVEGERRFVSPDADCSKIAQNLAFAVAVQLQLLDTPGADASTSESARTEREVARPDRKPALAPPAPPRGRTPGSQLNFGVGVGPFLVFGWSPEAALGGNLLLVGRSRNFSIQLAFEASLPRDFALDDGSGFETSVFAASIAPCLRFGAVEVCSALRLGQVRVQGFGVDEPLSARGLLAEAGLRLGLSRALGGGSEGRVHGEALGTLSPRTVQLNGSEAFSAPAVVFLAGVDLALFFL